MPRATFSEVEILANSAVAAAKQAEGAVHRKDYVDAIQWAAGAQGKLALFIRELTNKIPQ